MLLTTLLIVALYNFHLFHIFFLIDVSQIVRFKLKHHPEESIKRKTELQAALKRRLAVFMELYEKTWVDNVTLDQENSEQIIKFLDAGITLMYYYDAVCMNAFLVLNFI